ncbi:MAG: hypothetical protein JF606_27510 [Burkholderiales bacterium]|nr:hypothetical protein [Burkholderiales bacterium]
MIHSQEIREVVAKFEKELHEVDFMKPLAEKALSAINRSHGEIQPDDVVLLHDVLTDCLRRYYGCELNEAYVRHALDAVLQEARRRSITLNTAHHTCCD